MSTRSLISIQRGKNQYECIYCHSDGYLTYNGYMLAEYYDNKEKIEDLIKLGNISVLKEKLEPDPSRPHSFEDRQDDVTVAYGRDRDEKDQHSVNLTLEKMKDYGWIEYIYIYDESGNWKYLQYPFDEIKDVKKNLEKEFKRVGIQCPLKYRNYSPPEEKQQKKMKLKKVGVM